jgi:predicted RNase H-like nuclease
MDGRGVGCQAWGIVPYIKAWDSLILRQDPVMAPVYEVHPEVSFFAMNKERPLLHSKRTKEGENFRRYLVTRAFGDASLNQAKAALIGQRFAADDLLDAFAALWSAKRIAKNDAVILPERPENDSHGVQMAIRY